MRLQSTPNRASIAPRAYLVVRLTLFWRCTRLVDAGLSFGEIVDRLVFAVFARLPPMINDFRHSQSPPPLPSLFRIDRPSKEQQTWPILHPRRFPCFANGDFSSSLSLTLSPPCLWSICRFSLLKLVAAFKRPLFQFISCVHALSGVLALESAHRMRLISSRVEMRFFLSREGFAIFWEIAMYSSILMILLISTNSTTYFLSLSPQSTGTGEEVRGDALPDHSGSNEAGRRPLPNGHPGEDLVPEPQVGNRLNIFSLFEFNLMFN